MTAGPSAQRDVAPGPWPATGTLPRLSFAAPLDSSWDHRGVRLPPLGSRQFCQMHSPAKGNCPLHRGRPGTRRPSAEGREPKSRRGSVPDLRKVRPPGPVPATRSRTQAEATTRGHSWVCHPRPHGDARHQAPHTWVQLRGTVLWAPHQAASGLSSSTTPARGQHPHPTETPRQPAHGKGRVPAQGCGCGTATKSPSWARGLQEQACAASIC